MTVTNYVVINKTKYEVCCLLHMLETLATLLAQQQQNTANEANVNDWKVAPVEEAVKFV